jgi:hypothetical protein
MLRVMEDLLIGGNQLRVLVQAHSRAGIASEPRVRPGGDLHAYTVAHRETVRGRPKLDIYAIDLIHCRRWSIG